MPSHRIPWGSISRFPLSSIHPTVFEVESEPRVVVHAVPVRPSVLRSFVHAAQALLFGTTAAAACDLPAPEATR